MKQIKYAKTLSKEELIVLLLERDKELARLARVEAEVKEKGALLQAEKLFLAQIIEENNRLFGG